MNHYKWLEKHLPQFFKDLGLPDYAYPGILVAHGDKGYSYRSKWEQAGIHFYHGMALYLLSYIHPYSKESRETENGWVPVDVWVIEKYPRFKNYLPEIKDEREYKV